jgi:HlyD family type I secretion membrane fusion protein
MNIKNEQNSATKFVERDDEKLGAIAARTTTSPIAQDICSTKNKKHIVSADARLRYSTMSALPATLIGLSILVLFAGGTALWMFYVPVNAVISAPAEVIFKGKRQTVQHLEGGIVEKILVKDGDMVQAGQALIVLEDKQVKPIARMIQEQNIAERAQVSRLEAESKDLKHLEGGVGNKYEQTERRLFKARQEAYQNQIELIRIQISQVKESLKGSQERLSLKNQENAAIREQLAANQELAKEGYVTRSVILDQQRILAANSGERESIMAAIASDKQRIAEFEQRIISLKSDRVQGAVVELKQSALRRIDQEERIRPLRDTLERQVIRAPVTGRVVGLKVSTVGSTVVPREQLMEIAPTGETLILEAKIDSKDINEVKVGQEALVGISSFDSRMTLPLKAKVTYISADRISSTSTGSQPGQAPIVKYGALLEFEQDTLNNLGTNKLLPGMSANVAISIAPRTALDYMIKPMRESARKALYVR